MTELASAVTVMFIMALAMWVIVMIAIVVFPVMRLTAAFAVGVWGLLNIHYIALIAHQFM